MPRASDWIDLHAAARRLGGLWSIPPYLADELVHNAVESGDVLVRGMKDEVSLTPEIIKERPLLSSGSLATRLLWATLYRIGNKWHPMSQPLWRSLEINWPELRAYAPKIMPVCVATNEDREAELRLAPTDAIHEAITEVYDRAEQAGDWPPNIKELPVGCGSSTCRCIRTRPA